MATPSVRSLLCLLNFAAGPQASYRTLAPFIGCPPVLSIADLIDEMRTVVHASELDESREDAWLLQEDEVRDLVAMVDVTVE